MRKKLLVICGPTATGKTNLALSLAGKYGGEIVSADSRQLYRDMDISTGKDLQKDYRSKLADLKVNGKSVHIRYFETPLGIRIWGYDLAGGYEDFNVSSYYQIAKEVIINIWERKKLPIIVGGTGFYIKSLIDGIDTISYPPRRDLRNRLKDKTAEELYKKLIKLDYEKAANMNVSDRKNPVRLIRAIELVNLRNINIRNLQDSEKIKYDSLLIIGLTAPKEVLKQRIEKRIKDRVNRGFEKEVSSLLSKNIDWSFKSMQAMGYRQYEDYYNKKISWQNFIKRWFLDEQRYAKRQMTWFKKDKRIKWFDVSKKVNLMNVEKAVKNWYYE